MKEKDILEEFLNIGRIRGYVTFDEINDNLPSEFYSPDELENLMDELTDSGIKVIEYEDGLRLPEEIEEEVEEYERAEDLVQAYFNSMGDISILTKIEETELAKKLEEGKEIMRMSISNLSLFDKIKDTINSEEDEYILTESEKIDEAIKKTLLRLEELMVAVENEEKKVEKKIDIEYHP
jgi:Sigma-70 factor, region 1.